MNSFSKDSGPCSGETEGAGTGASDGRDDGNGSPERANSQPEWPDPEGGFGGPARNPEREECVDGTDSDERVLIRVQAGEHSAMQELYQRYSGLLYSQAMRVLHNPSEAEDVVIEVFYEAWRRVDAYHPERARPAAWLLTMVRRRAIDRYRERRSYEQAGKRFALEHGREPFGDGKEAGDQLNLIELRSLLEQALQRLPESQKQAVRMVYYQGMTQREISERTRTPLGTVKTRLELGLRKMRERIRSVRTRSLLAAGTGGKPGSKDEEAQQGARA